MRTDRVFPAVRSHRKFRIVAIWAVLVAIPLFFATKVSATHFVNHIPYWGCWSHTVGDNGYEIGIDHEVTCKGQPSAYFKAAKSDQAPKEFFVNIDQAFSAKSYRGKRMMYSAFVKGKGTNGWGQLWMKVSADNSVVAFDNMDNRRIKAASGWHKYSVVLDVPSDSTKIEIGFLCTGSGVVWLNGLSLTPVGDNIKTTAIPYNPKNFGVFADELPDKPRNLDFATVASEEGPRQLLSWAMIKGKDQKEYDIFVDRDTKDNGKPSTCVKSLVDDPAEFASVAQNLTPKEYRGRRLHFTADVKTSAVKDWAGIWARVDGEEGTVLAFDNMQDRRIVGTTDWKPCSVVLDVPEASKRIRIGFMQYGTGTSWVSNCSLRQEGSDVPTTGTAIVLKDIPKESLREKPILQFTDKADEPTYAHTN